jgi:UDP-N-acetylmuramoylalanine--D-glutamate ligase
MLNKALKYTVVGLGNTGLSCVEYLKKNNCSVTVVDTRQDPPNLSEFNHRFPDVPLLLGELTLPANTEVIVLSPGVSLQEPVILAAKTRGIPIVSDIELFAKEVTVPVIGVTGSNGKSTVVTLLSKMVEASGKKVGLGGNIGTPALSLLDQQCDCYILELSSFQLETTHTLLLKAATILNISPDHFDRHGNIEEYRAAKLRIYNNAEQIIVNREDIYTIPTSMLPNIKPISFGLNSPENNHYGVIEQSGVLYLAKGKNLILPINEIKLIGQQNIANALAALALAEALQLPLASCVSVLKTFAGLPHRCNLLGNFAGITWIDDSKGTNVGATVSAITGVAAQISGKLIVILGGISKGADLSPLLEPVLTYCRAVIVIGEAKELLKQLFVDKIPCYEARDMQHCVALAKQYACSGDGVLLSPACSSLDMFVDFQARGLAFKQAVLDIHDTIENAERFLPIS